MAAIAGAGSEDRRRSDGRRQPGRSGSPSPRCMSSNLEIVNHRVDPTFGFMTVDKDGKIRMDCSSPYAMASLIGLKDRFDIAFGNDPDSDRHGIVTPSVGLHEPEPLPGRGHLVSVPAPARLAAGCGRGQDAGLQLDDRPRGRPPGPAAGRGAGGLQVVRRWPGGRLVRLRRRGERRRLVPAHRRHGLDHRQGWHHPGPAGRGDHRRDRQGSGRALQGAGGEVRRPGLRAHGCAANAAQKKVLSASRRRW